MYASTILTLLKDEGIYFKFDRKSLTSLNLEKLSRFEPLFLYDKKQTSALHLLKSFIEMIDFN